MISLNCKTIAIIGAGPSGLAAAKYCRAEKAFSKIVVFEQRSSTGGVWNYTPSERSESLFTIPRTDPSGGVQEPVWKEVGKSMDDLFIRTKEVANRDRENKVPVFVSPVYDELETNIPRPLMGFSDLDWPREAQLFPKHETVLQYIQKYGEGVQDLVQLETQVVNVEPADLQPTGAWRVRTRNLRSGEEKEDDFDAVIVANGHFIVPYVPDIPGIKEWSEKFPWSISHSKYFRNRRTFAAKKVIVVGNAASGVDISTQIAPICKHPLLWSNKSASRLSPSPSSLKRDLPPIKSLDPSTRTVEFEDGTIESAVDFIIFATGYFYSLPFLSNTSPPLITNGSRVENTYKHLFYAPRPTLSFVALPQRVIPFPIAEAQSSVLARVYSNRLSLPAYHEMKKWEEKRLAEVTAVGGTGNTGGDGEKSFHLLLFPKDGNYINELCSWASRAEPREGLENEGHGKVAKRWGEWEFWCRDNFPAIKRAWVEKADERHGIRTLDELGGFVFEEKDGERREG
ncbi:flavin dependent monooxygenase-like protein [Delitschia confertaspora ATCC 74209]|uniref:Flavin dependent monooxygenase-like protein n=1 Tax=Delitschia confertaspora ATCC 74209 TaxID=1513339 RepID=A0A9P4JQB3_9PLEO|nr:flavin dependent monooxygenase-like protein [Delitschia confertaspora ATCC 74209]